MLVLLLAPYPFCVPQQLIAPEILEKLLDVLSAAAVRLIVILEFAIDAAQTMRLPSNY